MIDPLCAIKEPSGCEVERRDGEYDRKQNGDAEQNSGFRPLLWM